jgi:hypothetical protein
MSKKLQDNSAYNQYDADGDGVVSDEEIARAERLAELENKDRKEDQLRQMAWVAMGSMVFFTVALFLPFLSVERLTALDNLLSMFYIAQAGVVATFFGSSAYMSKS